MGPKILNAYFAWSGWSPFKMYYFVGHYCSLGNPKTIKKLLFWRWAWPLFVFVNRRNKYEWGSLASLQYFINWFHECLPNEGNLMNSLFQWNLLCNCLIRLLCANRDLCMERRDNYEEIIKPPREPKRGRKHMNKDERNCDILARAHIPVGLCALVCMQSAMEDPTCKQKRTLSHWWKTVGSRNMCGTFSTTSGDAKMLGRLPLRFWNTFCSWCWVWFRGKMTLECLLICLHKSSFVFLLILSSSLSTKIKLFSYDLPPWLRLMR